MHTLANVISAAVAAGSLACAAAPPSSTPCPSPPPAAPAAGVKAHSADELFAALKDADAARVDALLADDPALAAARSPHGASAILVAAFTLNPDQESFVKPSNNAMLRALLERRPELDVFDAALAGDAARLAALISEDPSRAAAFHPRIGSTPLHLAAFANRTDAIELLLARGAPVDAVAQNKFKNTPLVVAMLGDAVDAAALLLSRGANVEAPEDGGFRALHLAAEEGDVRLVKLLLDHGAQIDAKADDGTTPLAVAKKKGREAIATLLASRGAT